jgi:catechol 2,3-dioxygenase-like lactoylglutathione lyase family enzyme
LALNPAAANQGSSIRHLAIVTDNRERFVKFYTTVFGMKVVDGVGAAIYLSDGYLNMAIIQKRGNYKEGLYHFGMEVENIEELRSARISARQPKFKSGHPTERRSIALHGWPV